MKPKTILFVDHSPALGGASRVLLTILDALDPSRAEAIIACHDGSGVVDFFRQRGYAVEAMNLPGLTFHGGLLAMPRLAACFTGATRRLSALIRRRRVDAVHATGLTSALYCSAAAGLARVPPIWHVHEMIERRPRNVPFVRVAAGASRAIVCVSAASRARLVAFGVPAERCSVVYNAPPTPLTTIHDGPRATAPTDLPKGAVLAVGAITPLKGHNVLIEAALKFVRRYPALAIAIVGEVIVERDRGYFDELRASVVRYGLERNVRFLGLSHEVDTLLSRAAVVVHPSVEDEAFGPVPLEAMVAGKPVVASRIGGLPEVVADGVSGILVEPRHVAALTHAITVLLDDRALRERMGAAGRRIVAERFSLPRMLQDLNDVFTAVVGTPILRDPA